LTKHLFAAKNIDKAPREMSIAEIVIFRIEVDGLILISMILGRTS
jgi:hypothetical protein